MLYRIHKGGVTTYSGRQDELVYLVSRVSQIQQHGLAWAATDRNAALTTAKYTDQVVRLPSHIDWAVMEARVWTNTPTDGSRRERRMAEFPVHRALPWTAVVGIVTQTAAMAAEVESIIATCSHRPRVAVVPGWYF
jgi:ssDNA thymidine ADP-ribosyltransferase, DarT